MPVALFAALLGSLVIHAAALFGTDLILPENEPEPAPLRAELRPPPPAPPVHDTADKSPASPSDAKGAPASGQPSQRPSHRHKQPKTTNVLIVPHEGEAAAMPPAGAQVPEQASGGGETQRPAPSRAGPAKPLLPSSGFIRFAVFHVSSQAEIGEAEYRWMFSEDGHYTLTGFSKTSGLVALFKRERVQTESAGRLTARGLQPETYRVLRNGKQVNEDADFDWNANSVRLARDGGAQTIAPGTQDILSLAFQLPYLRRLEDGAAIGVVTGKKYERYNIDSLGEEMLDLPAGRFRTLHVRAMTDNVTEIWLSLDEPRLPVKIRFTDRKGASFEQVATEIGN